MSRPPRFEVVPAPDTLRRKALVAEGTMEEALHEAVARAEAALAELAPEFDAWMSREAERLAAAHRAWRAAPDRASRGALFRAAHSLRGQAGGFGYPLAGRICAGLARLAAGDGPLPPGLVDAHVEAVRAVVREGARRADDPLGSALAAELERLAAEVG